ncbi:hypothetical protein JTB14_014287 [Gonioctena quinquepunctata]|nr:hypothetical protein JTB14_014287 [Gonioctena quinquepunctata]
MEDILKIVNTREEYTAHLENDIVKTEQVLAETFEETKALEDLIENIKHLGRYPECESLIPLGKNILMKGNIIHTGEFYVKHNAHPDSFVVLKTLDQTLSSLETKVGSKKKDIDKVEYARLQLRERLKILRGDSNTDIGEGIVSGEPETDLPQEIESDKGVAVRVGEFYEILEFEKN